MTMTAYFEDGSPAMAELQAMVNRLEVMVEEAGLGPVLEAVEHICDAKAVQVIHTNPKAAHHWYRIAGTVREGAQVVADFGDCF
jgi:hypothetical protein